MLLWLSVCARLHSALWSSSRSSKALYGTFPHYECKLQLDSRLLWLQQRLQGMQMMG